MKHTKHVTKIPKMAQDDGVAGDGTTLDAKTFLYEVVDTAIEVSLMKS